MGDGWQRVRDESDQNRREDRQGGRIRSSGMTPRPSCVSCVHRALARRRKQRPAAARPRPQPPGLIPQSKATLVQDRVKADDDDARVREGLVAQMEISPLVHRAGGCARFRDSRLCRRPAVAAHDRSPATISTGIENSLSAQSPGVDLAPDDLVGRFAANHLKAGEFLTALRTAEISAGAVLDDSVRQALDQTTGPALVVLVQEVAAAGAVDGDGAECGQRIPPLARFG